MKKIGLIGGMSWESTITYYQVINRIVSRKLGGFHSAECILYSVDFDAIEACQRSGDWEKSGELLAAAARSLESAGAECIVICTNTMHKVASQIEQAVHIPLIHIADVTAQRMKQAGVRRAALLGTRYTMEQDFYKKRIQEAGIEILVPDTQDRAVMNDIIYKELCAGIISEVSRATVIGILKKLENSGADAAILGCTEIGLLVSQEHTRLPLFDTALLHAEEAALFALTQESGSVVL